MDLGVSGQYPGAPVPGFNMSNPAQDPFSGIWPSVEQAGINTDLNAPVTNLPSNYPVIGVGGAHVLSPGNLTTHDTQFGLVDDWNNVNMLGSNATTAMGDDSLNWATWDDMVQDFGIQNSGPANGQSSEIVPSFFGNGTNWY
jgi:hypothetical protein